MAISLEGLNKAEVLAALYNASKPQGMGFIHYRSEDMTVEEAQGELNSRSDLPEIYFDYLYGRVMKANLTKDTFDPFLYDRDNGEGAAAIAIGTLRE